MWSAKADTISPAKCSANPIKCSFARINSQGNQRFPFLKNRQPTWHFDYLNGNDYHVKCTFRTTDLSCIVKASLQMSEMELFGITVKEMPPLR